MQTAATHPTMSPMAASPGRDPDEKLPTLPPGAWWPRRYLLAAYSLGKLAKDPAHPHYGPLVNACLEGETYANLAAEWRKTPEGRAFLDARSTLQGKELDLDALASLPEGTLGRAFVQYFRDNGIAPFETTFPIHTDVDYLSKRYRETHDILHIITGYGTDELSEMELQAFVRGNLQLKQAVMINTFGGLRILFQEGPAALWRYVQKLKAAKARGRRSRELLSVPYETLWERPVAELRAMLTAMA